MGEGGCNTSNNLEKATFDRRYSSCAVELYPTILTFKHDLDDSIKLNQYAKHQGQRSSSSKVIVWTHRQTHKHTQLIALPGLLTWSPVSEMTFKADFRLVAVLQLDKSHTTSY